MNHFARSIRLAVLLLACATLPAPPASWAGEPATPPQAATADKSGYNLFHPTPGSALRDFNPDRPSQFTGPYTIDAGHVQVEMDFANYVFDSHNPERAPVRVDQWNAAPVVLRVGVVDRVELDVQYQGYFNIRTRDRTAGPLQTSVQSGFGDLTLFSKINLYGNEGGTTALAIYAGLKVPTSTAGLGNGWVEGNVYVPLNVNLPLDFQFGVETGVGGVRNSADTGYVAQFTNVATVSHPLGLKTLQGYIEFFSTVTTEHGIPVSGQFDVGITYQLRGNVQIDAGCNIGVTRGAPDYQPFTGLAVRF